MSRIWGGSQGRPFEHGCPGMVLFNDKGGGCEPRIDNNGEVWGCDAGNPVKILFCPFCGEKINPNLDEAEVPPEYDNDW